MPEEGAIAVICEQCADDGAEATQFVKGPVMEGGRAPRSELVEPFTHDLSKHTELNDLN